MKKTTGMEYMGYFRNFWLKVGRDVKKSCRIGWGGNRSSFASLFLFFERYDPFVDCILDKFCDVLDVKFVH
jgi:hypothetical protein